MASLYELTETIKTIDEFLSMGEDDDTQLTRSQAEQAKADLEFVSEMLDDVDAARNEKINSYCRYYQQLVREAELAKAEKEAWAEKQKVRLNKAERLRAALHEHMRIVDQKRITTGTFTVSRVKNGGRLPVEIEDVTQIPEEFFEPVEPKLLVSKIGEKLADGVEVPGCSLKERGESLRIK